MDNLFDFAVGLVKAQASGQAEIDMLCHKNDPETSRKAAERMVKSGELSRQEKIVFRGIQHHLIGGHREDFTAIELAKWMIGDTPKTYYMIQRRLSGLYRKGKIKRTGQKRNGCCVWKLLC